MMAAGLCSGCVGVGSTQVEADTEASVESGISGGGGSLLSLGKLF